jgi:MYXO-CTERM domain-containing protein
VMPSRTVTFTCRGITADLAATPAPVLFDPTRVGASTVERVTIRNTGNVSTTISSLGASPGSFSLEQGPSLPLTLAARATFSVDVRFTPTDDGDVEGMLVVTPQSGDPLSVALRGPGRVASFTLEPPQGDLGTVCIGQSMVQRFTLTSTGSADIEVSRPEIRGGGEIFELTTIEPAASAYPATLAPTATATIDVTATPTAPTSTATLRIATDVTPDGTVEVPLTVAAIADGVGVAPGMVDFGALPVEQTSEPIAVSLSNCGDAPLPILDLDITGDDAAAFDVGGTIPPPAISVPIASSMRWTVVFTPTRPGAHSAQLVIGHDGGMLTVPLTGMGATDAPDAGPGGPTGDGGAELDGTSYYACSCRAPASPGAAAVIALAILLAVRRRRRL